MPANPKRSPPPVSPTQQANAAAASVAATTGAFSGQGAVQSSSDALVQRTARKKNNVAAAKSLEAAGEAAMAADWRHCADKYLEAYQGSTDGWDRKYISWSGFTSVLREGNVEVLESDVDTLLQVGNDANAPPLHRVQAHFTYGFVANSEWRDVKESATGYRDCIGLAHTALKTLEAEQVMMATTTGYQYMSMKTVIRELISFANTNLEAVERVSMEQEGVGELLGAGGPPTGHQHAPGVGGVLTSVGDADAISEDPTLRTHSAVEYAHTYYEIAMQKRRKIAVAAAGGSSPGGVPQLSTSVGADGSVALTTGDVDSGTTAFEQALPMPQASPRECNVHSCVLLADDHACLSNRSCAYPVGHLAPMGMQFETIIPIDERRALDTPAAPRALSTPASAPLATFTRDDPHSTGSALATSLPTLEARSFWSDYVGAYLPLVIRGGALEATRGQPWDDDFLASRCRLKTGRPWRALIEKQNRITQNDRHPLMYDWTFCDFIHSYRKPEYHNMLYTVTPLSAPGVTLREHLSLPEALRCEELHAGMGDARLWMSGGNTTSSLHFDTHENYMLQIDGTKEVYMWHPNESHKFYSDFHNKFGLSPISADWVDLQRYPEFAQAATFYAKVHPGDAFYIPDGYWHLIISHGRNVAVALEFAPWSHGEVRFWPPEVADRYHWPGLFWAESVAIKYAMRERYGPTRYLARQTDEPIRCRNLAEARQPLSDIGWLGQEH